MNAKQWYQRSPLRHLASSNPLSLLHIPYSSIPPLSLPHPLQCLRRHWSHLRRQSTTHAAVHVPPKNRSGIRHHRPEAPRFKSPPPPRSSSRYHREANLVSPLFIRDLVSPDYLPRHCSPAPALQDQIWVIMASMLVEAPTAKLRLSQNLLVFPRGRRSRSTTPATFSGFFGKRTSVMPIMAMSSMPLQNLEKEKPASPTAGIPIMVNGCYGKMGKAVVTAAESAGLYIVPISFGSEEESGKTVEVCGKDIHVHGPSDRESVLASVFDKYPNLIVVDYTVPAAVNDNAELYCKVGVPFVMGTTGGDRDRLYKTVEDSKVYAVISPQMGKQVVAFLAAMEIMGEQFPGAFSGYSLKVLESHQASKLDTSGTAKAVVSCFQKMGVAFDVDQIQMIRNPEHQVEMVGVPKEHLNGHAFHLYNLTSPDETVTFEFQHNVCGRSIYAEGTVDALLFLSKKVQSKAEKRIYDMIDVLREGSMR